MYSIDASDIYRKSVWGPSLVLSATACQIQWCTLFVHGWILFNFYLRLRHIEKKKHSPLSPSPTLSFTHSLPPISLDSSSLPALLSHSPLSLFPSPLMPIPTHAFSLPLLLSTLFILGCSANSPTAAVQPHVQGTHYAGVWTDPHLPRYGQGLLLCKEC